MASPYDIDVRSAPYGARGNGTTDDTQAFRKAIAEATRRSVAGFGARVYVPPGKYVLFKKADERPKPIQIKASNITLFGDGPQSTLYIAPPWKQLVGQTPTSPGDPDSYAYFEIGRRNGGEIENVHIRGLRIQSDETRYNENTQRYKDRHLKYDPSQVFMMGVPHTLTGVVSNSGFSEILAENLAGVVFAFNGGSNQNRGKQSRNNYVLHNRVLNCCLQAVNPTSGGHAGTLVAHNVIDRNAGLAIEWSNSFALITNNIIRRARGGAFAFDNGDTGRRESEGGVAAVNGWIVFANNTILECGENFEGVVSPSIYGEPQAYRRVMIVNNAIQSAYGGGIVLAGADGSSEVVIHGNVIDGFGIDGRNPRRPKPPKNAPMPIWAGIWAVEKRRVVVTANVVRAGAGKHDRSEYGIATGGSNAEDCWTDGNVTIGTRDGGPAFSLGAIQTNDWGAATPGGIRRRDVPRGRVRTGRNVNLETGQPAARLDRTNHPYIPILPAGQPAPSVAGSDTWRVYQSDPKPADPEVDTFTIRALRDGYPGQVVSIVFYRGRAHVQPGPYLHLADPVPLVWPEPSTLTLLCVNVDPAPPHFGYRVKANRWFAAGESVIEVDTGSGAISVGDVVSFAGHPQIYAVTRAGGTKFTITPNLRRRVVDNTAVTFRERCDWIELSRTAHTVSE
jgi:pectate lyase-like protein